MEVEDINIHFAGYVLAEILNKATFSDKTQDGLLYGECNFKSTQSINDSQQDACRETTEVIVQDCTKCERTFSFYDQIGEVCEEKMTSIHGQRERHCVGFFSIRRNTRLTISLREKTIIHNLLKSCVFHHKKLLFFLVVPSKDENKATFNIKYKSFICETKGAGAGVHSASVKTDIINLGENYQNTYKHKSLVVAKKSDPSTQTVNVLQEYAADKFLSDTGSIGLADNSYSMFYKTSYLMNNLQEELIMCNETIEKYKDEIYLLEQCNQMDAI